MDLKLRIQRNQYEVYNLQSQRKKENGMKWTMCVLHMYQQKMQFMHINVHKDLDWMGQKPSILA